MPSFSTFALINLKLQIAELTEAAKASPEKREELTRIREAMERALVKTVLQHRAEQEAPKAIKH